MVPSVFYTGYVHGTSYVHFLPSDPSSHYYCWFISFIFQFAKCISSWFLRKLSASALYIALCIASCAHFSQPLWHNKLSHRRFRHTPDYVLVVRSRFRARLSSTTRESHLRVAQRPQSFAHQPTHRSAQHNNIILTSDIVVPRICVSLMAYTTYSILVDMIVISPWFLKSLSACQDFKAFKM